MGFLEGLKSAPEMLGKGEMFSGGMPVWVSIIAALLVIALVATLGKGRVAKVSTRTIVAIGIGAALYAVLSVFIIPVGPNTSFRLAIALLTIIGAIFGPLAGFLVGFIGHALNDAMLYGTVWWSWTFMSAFIGLFAGFIVNDRTFDVMKGKVTGKHIGKMYLLGLLGMGVGSVVAYLGDVFLYGEPATKVWMQILLANASNLVVIAVVGVPVVWLIAKTRKSSQNLKIED